MLSVTCKTHLLSVVMLSVIMLSVVAPSQHFIFFLTYKWARVLVPCKSFQPSIMFLGKAGAYNKGLRMKGAPLGYTLD